MSKISISAEQNYEVLIGDLDISNLKPLLNDCTKIKDPEQNAMCMAQATVSINHCDKIKKSVTQGRLYSLGAQRTTQTGLEL